MMDPILMAIVGCAGSVALGQLWVWVTGSDKHMLIAGAAGAVAALQYYEIILR